MSLVGACRVSLAPHASSLVLRPVLSILSASDKSWDAGLGMRLLPTYMYYNGISLRHLEANIEVS